MASRTGWVAGLMAVLWCASASADQLVHRFQGGLDILYAEGAHNDGADDVTVRGLGADFRYMPAYRFGRQLFVAGDLSVGFSAPTDVGYNDEEHSGNAVVSAFGGGGLLWDGGQWFSAVTAVYGTFKESVAADGSEYLTIAEFPMVRLATGVTVTKVGRGHVEIILSGGIGFPTGRYSPQDWTVARAGVSFGFVK